MKKTGLLVLVTTLALAISGCGGNSPGESKETNAPPSSAGTSAASSVDESVPGRSIDPFIANIQPLDKVTKLKVGVPPGCIFSFPSYLAGKLGIYEQLNIDAELTHLAGGIPLVEAMKSGDLDVASYGIAGAVFGSIQDVTKIVSIYLDECVSTKVLIRADSDMAKAGRDPNTGILGTPDTWKGKEVYLQSGTNLQYLVGTGLEKMGLTWNDITLVNMDPNNINTAMYAGRGDAWALWNMFGYSSSLGDEYVEAFNGSHVGISLPTVAACTVTAYENPETRAAVYKWVEINCAIADWINASDENFLEAIDYMVEWYEDQGTAGDRETIVKYVQEMRLYDTEYIYKLFTEKSESDQYIALERVYAGLDFYISEGNYLPEQRDDVSWDDFAPEIITGIYESRSK